MFKQKKRKSLLIYKNIYSYKYHFVDARSVEVQHGSPSSKPQEHDVQKTDDTDMECWIHFAPNTPT